MVCSVFQVAAVRQRTVRKEAGGGEGKLLSVHLANKRARSLIGFRLHPDASQPSPR